LATSRLGGAIDTLSPRDALATIASMGNPRGRNGGYLKSPLAGSMVGLRQLNHANLPKNDSVDPLGEDPDAQDALVTVLPTASIIAVTVAELSAFDPGGGGGGDGGGGDGGGGTGSGDGGGGTGSGGGPSGDGGGGGAGPGGVGDGAF